MRSRRLARSSTNHIVAGITGVIVCVPIYLVFVNSLKTRPEASSMGVDLPAVPQWDNFATVIEEGKLAGAFFNSLLYSIGATAICVTLAAMAAYVLARHRSRRHRILYLLLIMGIAMPTNFVTLMQVMQWTHLINTQLGIILLYAAMQIPFSVFLIYAFMETLPRELDEAALIDGCTPLRAFFRVIFPLLTPVLVTLSVLSILNIWNEFLMPLYFLNSSSALADDAGGLQLLRPVPVRLESRLGRRRAHHRAGHRHLHRRPALDPVRHECRRGQGLRQ